MKLDRKTVSGVSTLLSPLLLALSIRISVLGWAGGAYPAFIVLIVYWGFWCSFFPMSMRRFSINTIRADYGLSRCKDRKTEWMTFLGVVITLVFVALTLFLPLDIRFNIDNLNGVEANAIIFLAALGNGFFEEIYWRAFLFGTMKKKFPKIVAYLYSAIWFTAYHAIGWGSVFPVFQGQHIAFIMIIALFFTYLFDKSKSLLPSISAHISLDILMFAQGLS